MTPTRPTRSAMVKASADAFSDISEEIVVAGVTVRVQIPFS